MSVAGTGRQLHGLKLHGALQIAIPYTKTMETAIEQADAIADAATPFTEVEPKDRGASDVLTFNAPDLSAFWLAFPGIERRMRFPDVMQNLTLQYEDGSDSANYDEISLQAGSGQFSVSCSLAGQCQASAYSIPKLVPKWSRKWSFNQIVTNYFFFSQSFTMAGVLAKISAKLGTTVNAWPSFGVDCMSFILSGERVMASARATLQGTDSSYNSGGSASQSNGFGDGYSRSPTIEVVEYPECLHGAFSLSATNSQTANATTTISSDVFGASGGSASVTANGSVTPNSVAATSPAALPTSGLYMFDFEVEPSSYFSWYLGHATVFDFANLV